MQNSLINHLDKLCDIKSLQSIPTETWPLVSRMDRDGSSVTIQCQMQSELPWFNGHFPGQPVLPGVVQVHWAALLAPAMFNLTGRFEKISRLKFKSPILPQQKLDLTMVYNAESVQVNFNYRSQELDHSNGTIHFAHTEHQA